jgi:hypothetical protein
MKLIQRLRVYRNVKRAAERTDPRLPVVGEEILREATPYLEAGREVLERPSLMGLYRLFQAGRASGKKVDEILVRNFG